MKQCPIIYENEEIIIINKASGVAVQGGEGVSHPLDEELSRERGSRVHLVRRLDKDTSGLLVVAKSATAAARWTELIAGKQVKKVYTAVCFGAPVVDGVRLAAGESATIRAPVSKGARRQDAVTHVTVRKRWTLADAGGVAARADGGAAGGVGAAGAGNGAASVVGAAGADDGAAVAYIGGDRTVPPPAALELSLLQLTLGTGRMHQLRIHLAGAGAPIVGDDKHGDFRQNKRARARCGARQLMLAATTISLPVGGTMRTFTVPLPAHIAALVATAPQGGIFPQ